MTQVRIAPLDADHPVAQAYGAPPGREGPVLNIFRTLARNEPLFKQFSRLGGHLLRRGEVPAREREIVILRVGYRCASEYEFGQHTVIGRDAGVTDEEIARLADSGSGGWSPDDQALVDMVDDICDQNMVSDRTWGALASRWSDSELLELLVLTGYYRLVSGLLNSAAVALEAHTPGWPEGSSPMRRAPRDSS